MHWNCELLAGSHIKRKVERWHDFLYLITSPHKAEHADKGKKTNSEIHYSADKLRVLAGYPVINQILL